MWSHLVPSLDVVVEVLTYFPRSFSMTGWHKEPRKIYDIDAKIIHRGDKFRKQQGPRPYTGRTVGCINLCTDSDPPKSPSTSVEQGSTERLE